MLIVVGVVAGLLLAGALQAMTKGSAATYGGEQSSHQGATKISLLPGSPGSASAATALYAKNDPWKAYLADEQTCPGGEELDAPLAEQANTMVCLVNYARRKRGLQPVATVGVLNQSSLAKANRIVRCLDFNHNACGEAPEADIRALGYNGAWGENLFISGGPYGAPRPVTRRLAELAGPPREPLPARVALAGDRGREGREVRAGPEHDALGEPVRRRLSVRVARRRSRTRAARR